MWLYKQSTGELFAGAEEGVSIGVLAGTGYAGFGAGKNNPELEAVHLLGPLPKGLYRFGSPEASPKLGPLAIPLIPDDSNEMFGRSAFFLHADSITHPGEASEGCIVMARDVRQRVFASADKDLRVIA
ncbi:MAG TPA: tlde1 domain-containing protein [Bryobacteraceae bacterium]|jgi:hypothetical protein|nr:tlde1 domain-containing protein [Bryobacteraceae bacterium]